MGRTGRKFLDEVSDTTRPGAQSKDFFPANSQRRTQRKDITRVVVRRNLAKGGSRQDYLKYKEALQEVGGEEKTEGNRASGAKARGNSSATRNVSEQRHFPSKLKRGGEIRQS